MLGALKLEQLNLMFFVPGAESEKPHISSVRGPRQFPQVRVMSGEAIEAAGEQKDTSSRPRHTSSRLQCPKPIF